MLFTRNMDPESAFKQGPKLFGIGSVILVGSVIALSTGTPTDNELVAYSGASLTGEISEITFTSIGDVDAPRAASLPASPRTATEIELTLFQRMSAEDLLLTYETKWDEVQHLKMGRQERAFSGAMEDVYMRQFTELWDEINARGLRSDAAAPAPGIISRYISKDTDVFLNGSDRP